MQLFKGTSVLSPASPLFLLVIPAWVIAYKSDQVKKDFKEIKKMQPMVN